MTLLRYIAKSQKYFKAREAFSNASSSESRKRLETLISMSVEMAEQDFGSTATEITVLL